ncbi:MAG: hypothetical protein PVI73_02390 [Syntrophobacterales bacterium]
MPVISEYNRQQKNAILMVRQHLSHLPDSELRRLKKRIESYLQFRKVVNSFQDQHFADICSQKCFTSYESACCGREGIITFFADVVINVLLSTREEIDVLLDTIDTDTGGSNCVYLNNTGCLWRLKPIVCEMFLCEHAKTLVLDNNKALKSQWEKFRQRERRYTWPSRPVLFDELEAYFIEAGCDSPLMYLHLSPGLLRLKARHGLDRKLSTKVHNV